MGASAMLVTPCMLYPYLIELYSLRERKNTKALAKIFASAFLLCSNERAIIPSFMRHSLPHTEQLIVACFQHALDVLPLQSPHTALHFVTLMWGYYDIVPPARKVYVPIS